MEIIKVSVNHQMAEARDLNSELDSDPDLDLDPDLAIPLTFKTPTKN
jgi:hypothetical protein